MNIQNALTRFHDKTFTGLSDYYPPESEAAFLRITLWPDGLIIEHKHPTQGTLITHEAEYDDGFQVIAFREKINGALHKEYSRGEIKEDKYNIISGHFLLRDPRYVLRMDKDHIQLSENSFLVTVFEDEIPFFGKTSVKVEIIFEENAVRVIRRKFVRGNRELKNQREIINFVQS